MSYITTTMDNLIHQTAFFNMTWGNVVMILVACVFLYLAIAKEFEPLLLVPIAFGMLLVNIYPDIMLSFEDSSNGVGGLLYYFYKLDEWAILPSLIFMGVGAMTDFGPLIANPKSFLLGAAAQFGIFAAYFGAIAMGFNDKAAAAISIIGGADGPTSIFLCGKLGQTQLLGPIAVAAYSYMSLVPIIQPPIMKLLTTEKERKIKMEQLRPVTKLERILFPIIVTIVVCLILPTTAPLVGMLMLGNLFRESGVVRQLADTASNALMYIVVILLGTSVGATTSAEAFLNWDTIKIVVLGLIAFAFGTAAGVLFGKLMCKVSHGKVNPLIGSAGVSAVPMAARVSQKVGAQKLSGLQASFRVTVLRPRIGKIQVNAIQLSLRENVFQIFCIHADQANVRQLFLLQLLNRAQQHAGIFFDTDKVDFRVKARHIHQETSLAHADFHINRMVVAKRFSPLSFHRFRFVYDKLALPDHFPTACNIA